MVRSDLGAAGVMFPIDPESGFEDVVFITSSYGLGETVGAALVAGPRRLVRWAGVVLPLVMQLRGR